MRLPQNIPTGRLIALLKASDEMMKSVFHRSRQDTLDTLAGIVKGILEAEAAAIFLVDEDAPNELLLSAYALDMPINIEKIRLTIQDIPKGGMTGYIAFKREIVRLHGRELREHPNNAGNPISHLRSGQGFSTMGIPLKDRKGRVLGIAKVDNKKGPDGIVSETAFFDEVDEFIARVLLNKIVLVLESLRTFDALRALMEAMHRARTLEAILNEILKTGMNLIGADRGDFVWWDVNKLQLVRTAQYEPERLEPEEVWPERSIVHEVWRTREPALIGDVLSDEKYRDIYYEVQPATRSEVAVCLEFEGKAVGVLNAESSQLNWFDEHDLELLQLLGQYATIATQVIGEEAAFRGIVRRLTARSPSREEILNGILMSLASIFGFDAGLIFIADYERRTLHGSASIGCEGLGVNPKEYEYDFDDIALTTKVLRDSAGYFSPNPKHDPEVHQKGLEAFQIDSPLVGVPLIHAGKPVGVLVSWSRRNNHPTEKHIEELEPFASLAATIIAVSETERQRTRVILKIGDILNQLQTEMPLRNSLDLILEGIREVGFDRVRAFEFKQDTQNFTCLASLGMEKPEDAVGYVISIEKNPYIQHTAQSWSTDTRAKRFDSGMFGSDPDGAALGKDPALPWAIVPLVTNGKLYGYIEAENGLTKREITEDNLEYLTLYGSLAGQVIANHHTIDVLRASKIRDDFLQHMAHIFVTRATSVEMAVKNMEDGAVTAHQFKNYFLPGILKINKEYLRLGQQMRDFSELGEDTMLKISLVDLAGLARDAIDRLRGAAQARKINLQTDIPFTTPSWPVDRTRVARAVEALLENAIKFSPKGKTVYVTIETDDKNACLSVRDEGEGIPENEARFVFDSFFRASNAKNAHIEGTGLGLSIVARTMELHGGQAKVRNSPEGGAEFMLVFPRMEAESKLD